MKRGVTRFTIPLITPRYSSTRKPIDLKVTVCSRVQNKQITYYKEDVGDCIQDHINKVFSIINRYTQDLVIEHLTDTNQNEPVILISIKVNVYGVVGRQLLNSILKEHQGFVLTN